MSWGMTFSWENIIILSQEFPHYGKIFRFNLAQPCTNASSALLLTLLYVSVGSWACLQLFTYDGFSTRALSPAHVALCSAQLSLSSFFLLYFSFPLLFTPCLPSFHASNLSSFPAPHHCQPSPATTLPPYISPNPEVPIFTQAWQAMGVSFLLFLTSSPYSFKPLSAIYLRTASSHVRKTCRHPSATFDHCFYWDPLPPCSALGWQGEAESERMKGRTE